MKEFLSENEIKFAYVDICSGIGALRSFLKVRDTSNAHAAARESHSAGIPTLVIDDNVFIVNVENLKQLTEEFHLTDKE